MNGALVERMRRENSERSSECPLVPTVPPVRKKGSENPECIHPVFFSHIVPKWNVPSSSFVYEGTVPFLKQFQKIWHFSQKVHLQIWNPPCAQAAQSSRCAWRFDGAANQRGLARVSEAAVLSSRHWSVLVCLCVRAQQQPDSLFGSPGIALLSRESSYTKMTSS